MNGSETTNAGPLVSIVILTYRSAQYVGQCLRSIAGLEYSPLEIVVADNASTDGSLDVALQAAHDCGLDIKTVPLSRNLGCAGGNNAGWRASAGQIVVFLNPDTEVTPSLVGALVKPLLQDSSIGVTGAKIYYPNSRTMQHAGARICPNGMSNHFGAGEEDRGQYDEVRDVDYVTGAGFAVRRSLLEELDGFDEDYFPAYFEETDFCTRARKQGWRVLYVPTAVFYHHESVSLTVNSPAFHRLYQRMRIRYCIKNFTLRDWVRRFLPFEYWWMRHEPHARGHRREQFRAYAEGAWWLLGKCLRRLIGR